MNKTSSCCQIPTRMSSPAPMFFPPFLPAAPWWKFQWRTPVTLSPETVRQKALSDRKNLNINTAWNSFSPEELEIKTKLCELISELNPMDSRILLPEDSFYLLIFDKDLGMVEILIDIERETKCPDTLFFPEKESLTLTFGEVVRCITRWRIENNLKNIPMNSPPSRISQYGRLIF